MSKIIFLNGCGSSGKTSIAKAIQHIASEPWLHLGVDTFADMLPEKYQGFGEQAKEGYYAFVEGQNSRGPVVSVINGPLGNSFFPIVVPKVAALMADYKQNLILDEVLLDQKMVDAYMEALSNHSVCMVQVMCDLNTMQEREVLRGDRALGLSNGQFDQVHHYNISYDLTVDTTHTPALENAQRILSFIA